LLFVSCKKDTTRPQLSYVSVNTNKVNPNQALIFTLHFTDPTGGADSLFVKEVVNNCPVDSLVQTLALPDYSAFKGDYGDILVPFGDGVVFAPDGNPYLPVNTAFTCNENDTAYFRFVLKNDAGEASDTVNSGTIVVVF